MLKNKGQMLKTIPNLYNMGHFKIIHLVSKNHIYCKEEFQFYRLDIIFNFCVQCDLAPIFISTTPISAIIKFFKNLLEHVDRNQLGTFCYANSQFT